MRKSLFRLEAVEGLKPKLVVEVIAARPLRLQHIVRILAVLIALTLLASFLVEAPQYRTAQGTVVPESGLIAIKSPLTGRMDLAPEGARLQLKAGDVIATVRSRDAIGEGSLVSAEKLGLLDQQKKVLVEMRRNADATARIDGARISASLERANAELAEVRNAENQASEAISLLEKQVARDARLLAIGAITSQVADTNTLRLLDNRQTLARSRQASQRLIGELATLGREREGVTAKYQQQLSDLALKELGLADSTLTATAANEQTLTAPSAGRLVAATTAPGPVEKGETLFMFAPEGPLVVKARVSPDTASAIKPGCRAVVRLEGGTGYDLRTAEGKVTYISEAAYAVAETGASKGATAEHTLYVELPKEVPFLRVGGAVTVYLEEVRKPLIKWLVKL